MALHPTLKEMIQVTAGANNSPLSKLPLREVREGPKKLKPFSGEPTPLAKVMNRIIHFGEDKIRLRLYYPRENAPLPVILYFHPGGFVKGDIDASDNICRALAFHADALVISVNYPLAPENPFPAALLGGQAVLHWIASHPKEVHSNGTLIVCGEGAGGNLCAALAQTVKDEPCTLIAYQVLIYPHLDLTHSSPSIGFFGKGFLLEKESLDWYAEQYAPHEDLKDPRISPLYAKDFSRLPPALIITAEYDPLRDDGETYAQKLKQAGVEATLQRHRGMVHGFLQLGGLIDDGRLALEEIGNTLRSLFGHKNHHPR